jgi:hypothetical protein
LSSVEIEFFFNRHQNPSESGQGELDVAQEVGGTVSGLGALPERLDGFVLAAVVEGRQSGVDFIKPFWPKFTDEI